MKIRTFELCAGYDSQLMALERLKKKYSDFVTDCPYGEKGRYTNAINKVGDLGCNTCEWQVRHDSSTQVVMCSHPKV